MNRRLPTARKQELVGEKPVLPTRMAAAPLTVSLFGGTMLGSLAGGGDVFISEDAAA
jgi:hypothetical protein